MAVLSFLQGSSMDVRQIFVLAVGCLNLVGCGKGKSAQGCHRRLSCRLDEISRRRERTRKRNT